MRASASAAVAAIAFGLAACGDTGPPDALEGDEARQALADAIEPTAFEGEPVTVDSTLSVFAASDLNLELRYSIDIDAMELVARGELARTGEPDIQVEAVVDGDQAWYMSSAPEFMQEQEADWITGSVEELDRADAGAVSQPLQFTSHLYLLMGAHDVEAAGTAVIEGAGVRVYEFSIDTTEAFENTPAEYLDQLEQAIIFVGEGNLDGTAELDAEGRVRRLTIAVPPVVEPPPPGPATPSLTLEFSAFGEAVDVQPPPPGEVAPVD